MFASLRDLGKLMHISRETIRANVWAAEFNF